MAVGLLTTLWLGCTERPAAPTSPAQPADSAEPGQRVELTIIDETDLARALARHQGKVVLVDYWATWCAPCVELFPHTVQLHRELAAEGLEVISVSLDDTDNEPQVRRFLATNRADFENFLSRYGTSPKSMEALNIPGGSLPHLKLYDRHGKIRHTFNAGEFQPADVDRQVRQLLRES